MDREVTWGGAALGVSGSGEVELSTEYSVLCFLHMLSYD